MQILPFNGKLGIKCHYYLKQINELFKHFFTDELIDYIIYYTNSFADLCWKMKSRYNEKKILWKLLATHNSKWYTALYSFTLQYWFIIDWFGSPLFIALHQKYLNTRCASKNASTKIHSFLKSICIHYIPLNLLHSRVAELKLHQFSTILLIHSILIQY